MAGKKKKAKSPPKTFTEDAALKKGEIITAISTSIVDAFTNPMMQDIVRRGVEEGVGGFLEKTMTRKGKK